MPSPTAQPTDHDRARARTIVDAWRAVRAPGTHLSPFGLDELTGNVARAIAEGRAEGRAAALAVFETLFAGGPDTSIRTVWDESQAVPALGIGPLECASVPMDDLRAAFDEAARA